MLPRVAATISPLITPQFFKITSGALMPCNKEVKNFCWWVQGNNFTYDLRVLDLGSYDIILGMDWLELWGEMCCQWKQKWTSFQYLGQEVVLQGILPSD